MIDEIKSYLSIIYFYLPIGIIGIWRWGVWTIRKAISFLYQPPAGRYKTSLSVVTPVYNENPALFERAVRSWAKNQVDEIIAIIDYTDEKNIAFFRQFQNEFPASRLVVTHIQGKRPALAAGIERSQGEIVALVDSDTVWPPDIKDRLTGPFVDAKVGGLVTRQDVFETDTFARKLFKILLDDRYLFEYPFLATVSDALLCLSGRTAVYRRSAIINELDDLVNDFFMGRPMISGDDKSLTHIVHRNGWKTRYVKDVSVYTSGTPSLGDFMKQKLRWTRNGLRLDSRALKSRWLWKHHKILGLHMLDKFISPLALLLSPIFFIYALILGHWFFASIIFVWWLVSRLVKLIPHLREKPKDIWLIPAYIGMTFVMALIKLYALFTIDEQGWITRWDKSRQVTLGFLRKSFSWGLVGMFLMTLVSLTFFYNDFVTSSGSSNYKEPAHTIMTPYLPRLTNQEIETERNTLEAVNQGDAYGYYTVIRNDTLSDIRRKYNIPADKDILDAATKRPLGRASFLTIGQKLAIPVEDLRHPLTKAVMQQSFRRFPRVNYEAPTNTIFVRQSGAVVTLSDISRALGPANRSRLEELSPGEWILRSNLYITKNISLILDGEDVKHLKLKSDSSIVWIRAESANVLINNTKITSWDESRGAPDENLDDGRSYITVTKNARMDVIDSEIAYLGSVGYPKRGGAFGGSYGLSWKNRGGGYPDMLLTGVVSGNKLHHNYFGFYTYGATGMLVENNEVYENVEYGLDPHDDSNNFLVYENKVHNNGNHGIIFSKRCFNNIIQNNYSYDNRLHGIMLDRSSNNNLVANNWIWGNTDGVALYESNGNLIVDNDIRHNERGIRLNRGASNNYMENNFIFANSRGLYLYDESRGNIAYDNKVRKSDVGITLKNASDNLFVGNLQVLDNKKDGRVTEGASGNNIQ